MAHPFLATYLNDHLAGAVSALELLDDLLKHPAGATSEQSLATLKADILADRKELEALMSRLDLAVSNTRKAGAWLAEKMTQLKLWIDDPEGGSLRRLESLEAVAIGIEGKRALWRSLATAAQEAPFLRIADYARLEQRADDQRRRIEPLRLEAAQAVLGKPISEK